MEFFSEKGFNEGRWAGQLAQVLRKCHIIPELSPKARIWRASWKQWIQFEEPGLTGPVFWLGKPGIISNEEALYAGFYVERGLPRSNGTLSMYVITPKWHWHGFAQCLGNPNLRSALNSLLQELPRQRSCIWIRTDQGDQHLNYESENTLLEAKTSLTTLPSDIWIEVILGVFFRKSECLGLQAAIIPELNAPIIRAYEISSLVKDAMRGKGPF